MNAKDSNMAAYRATVDQLAQCFIGYEVRHIPRTANDAVDELSRLGSACKPIPEDVFLEHLHAPSVKGADQENQENVDSPVHAVFVVTPGWTVPYMEYLTNGTLPKDEVRKREIIRRAKAYTIING